MQFLKEMITTIRTTRLILVAVLAVGMGVASTGCDGGGSNQEGDNGADALIPLQEGNRWEAEVEAESATGPVPGTATAEVTSAGEEVSLSLTVFGTTTESTLTLSNESDGLLLESLSEGTNEETDVILLKYPAQEGDTYEHTDGDGDTFEVNVSETPVSVEAGDFDSCLEYEISDVSSDAVSVVTIKPGVGPVLFDFGIFRFELASTNVGD